MNVVIKSIQGMGRKRTVGLPLVLMLIQVLQGVFLCVTSVGIGVRVYNSVYSAGICIIYPRP